MTERDQVQLPPLPATEATDRQRHDAIVARMVARFGAPALADYRRIYDAAGLSWPGDEQVRRMYPTSDASHSAA